MAKKATTKKKATPKKAAVKKTVKKVVKKVLDKTELDEKIVAEYKENKGLYDKALCYVKCYGGYVLAVALISGLKKESDTKESTHGKVERETSKKKQKDSKQKQETKNC